MRWRAGLTTLGFALVAATEVFAQGAAPSLHMEKAEVRTRGALGHRPVYTVKVICGTPAAGELAPGRYFTAINIRNFTPLIIDAPVLRVFTTDGQTATVSLPAIEGYAVFEIDGGQIAALLKADPNKGFIKGFVEIDPGPREPDHLIVVAVYTTAPGQ